MERRLGKPRTEAERAKAHQEKFGTSGLPERGTGSKNNTGDPMENLVKLIQKIYTHLKIKCRPCVVKLTTIDAIINSGPCLAHAVCVAGDGAVGNAQVYDGTNAFAEEKTHIEVLGGTTFNWEPPCGAVFNYGIYIVVSAATTHCTVTYKPLTEEELKILRG